MDSLHLRNIIDKALDGSASERDVTDLVRHSYEIALVRLKQLLHSGRLHLQSFSVSLEGVAFDSIAELFQRNENGEFVELKNVFSGEWHLSAIDQYGCTYRLRSVIFASLQDGIIRLYREHDPVLNKILRNLKLALKARPSIYAFDRLGMQYISGVPHEERNDQLPELPIGELERRLSSSVHSNASIPRILTCIVEILTVQEDYRRFYGLLDIALVTKRLLIRDKVPMNQLSIDEPTLLDQDISLIISTCLVELKLQLQAAYASKGKIPAEQFQRYFQAIEVLIHDVYERNDGKDMAQPDYLAQFIPGLSREEYRNNHRTHFEYMVRLAKKAVSDRLKELL